MQKMMKMLIVLSVILSAVITAGCKTIPEQAITLPPKPEREVLESPKNLKDFAEILVYYNDLVSQWELWGDTVEKMIEKKD